MHSLRSAAHRLVVSAMVFAAAPFTYAAATVNVSDSVILPSSAQKTLPFTVTRSGDLGFDVTVKYATKNGTALAGRDYRPVAGTVTILAGSTSATVNVPLLPVVAREPRSLTLTLSDAVPGKQGIRAWTPAATVAVPGGLSEGAVVADFNGDGKPDIALPSEETNDIYVIRNDTAKGATFGNFATSMVLSSSDSPIRLAIGDLNGDGKPDLIAPNQDTGVVDIYTNTTPAFAPNFSFQHTKVTYPAAGAIEASIADIDGDGRPDIVIAVNTPGKVVVLLNRTPPGATTPTFAEPAVFDVSSDGNAFLYCLTMLDVDGDGRPDVAVGNLRTSEVVILRNTTVRGASVPTFAAPVAFRTANGATGIATADIDGDGRPDLVTAENGIDELGSTWSVLLNRTVPGTSQPRFSVTSRGGPTPYTVALKDIDGDGRADIVFSALTDFNGTSGGGLAVYLNQTEKGADVPNFLQYAFIPTENIGSGNGAEPHTQLIGDFNGDGREDLAQMNFIFTKNLQVFFALSAGIIDKPQALIANGAAIGTIKPHFGLLP